MFRFSMRDILWSFLVVALGVSWISERSRGKALEYRYDRLMTNVLWCPPEMHIVFDKSGDFHFERRPETWN